MFDKNSLTRLVYSVNVAVVITLTVLLLTSHNPDIVLFVFKGMLAGASIWFAGEILFSVCEKIFPTNVLAGYVVLFLLILCGTSGFAYLFGMRDIVFLLGMSAAAEVFGLGITFFYRGKVTRDLNVQLMKHKNNPIQ